MTENYEELKIIQLNRAVKKPLTLEEFWGQVRVPDFLIDDLLQRGYVYSLTGATNAGKTALAALLCCCADNGLPFAGHQCEKTGVLYLCGENTDDFRLRTKAVYQYYECKGDLQDHNVHIFTEPFPLGGEEGYADYVCDEIDALGGKGLVIVDTSAAYFGKADKKEADENDNSQMIAHAKACQKLAKAKGNPTVLVLAHPCKNATRDMLLPRGAYAFLCAVDGNLTLWNDDGVLTLGHTKIRGAAFEEIIFHLEAVDLADVLDTKGRQARTIIAKWACEDEAKELEQGLVEKQERLLMMMHRNPSVKTSRGLGEICDLSHAHVQRLMKALIDYHYVVQDIDGYELTSKKGIPKARKLSAEFKAIT